MTAISISFIRLDCPCNSRKLEKYIEINKIVNRYKINCYILFSEEEISLRQIIRDL